jgi:hypothetical protein
MRRNARMGQDAEEAASRMTTALEILRFRIRNRSNRLVIAIAASAMILSVGPAALAISVDLAKKCRDMAVKAHPPAPAGTRAYAEAERVYFRQCVTKNGNMDDDNASGKAKQNGPN